MVIPHAHVKSKSGTDTRVEASNTALDHTHGVKKDQIGRRENETSITSSSKSTPNFEKVMPSFSQLKDQHNATESLSKLSLNYKSDRVQSKGSSLSSTSSSKSSVKSRVESLRDAEEWRDSSGYIDSGSDDSDDDCTLIGESNM